MTQHDAGPEDGQRDRLTGEDLTLMAGVGALAGAALRALLDGIDDADPMLTIAPSVGVVTLAGAVVLLWPGPGKTRRVLLALALAVTAAALTIWRFHIAGAGADGEPGFAALIWLGVEWPLLGFLGLTLGATALEAGALRWPYPVVFRYALALPVAAAMGAATAAAMALFILMWAGAFAMMGAGFIAAPLQNTWLLLPAAGAAGALGASFTLGAPRLRGAGEAALLIGSRIVAPLLAIFSAMFALLLPFTGIEALGDTLSPTGVLLALALSAMLVVNGVYRDGAEAPAGALRGAVWLAIAALPIFSTLALYGIGARVAAHGLTPERLVVLVVAALTAAYTLLLLAGLVSELPRWRARRAAGAGWMPPVARTNVRFAFAWLAVIVLMQTPALDPLVLSARDQTARLERGGVDAEGFDYAYLQFRLGRPGRAALERMDGWADHPQAEAIRAGADRARQADSYFAARQEPEPEAAPLPPELTQQLETLDAAFAADQAAIADRLIAAAERLRAAQCAMQDAPLDDPARETLQMELLQRRAAIFSVANGAERTQAVRDALAADCSPDAAPTSN